MVSLISVDLDGTILQRDGSTITKRTLEAVKHAMARGAYFVLNSGRMPDSVRPMAETFGVNAPSICFNGALTYDTRTNEVCGAAPLSAETARALAERIEAQGVYLQGFWGDTFYYEQFTQHSALYQQKAGVIGHATGKKLSSIMQSDVYKLLMIGEPGEALAITPALEREFGDRVSFVASSPTFVECVSIRASKGEALHALAAQLGVPDSGICAFGDEQNDISMLSTAAYGYAMGNASDEVKAHARFVAPRFDEDGVAQVLEQLLAQNLIGACEGGKP